MPIREMPPAWANAILVQIRELGTKMERMEARMEARMDRMDARMDTSHSRVYNASISRYDDSILRPIVKYNPGHPGQVRRREFQFDEQQYAVGTPPPSGLVPNTLPGIWEIDSLSRFKAIYWFYNDQRLTVGDRSLSDLRSSLAEFLKYS